MSWVTLLGVILGRAAGRASCFTSWAVARSDVTASAHAPTIANAVRTGLMVFLPDGQLSALCSNRNGRIFLLSLPNVTPTPQAVKACSADQRASSPTPT